MNFKNLILTYNKLTLHKTLTPWLRREFCAASKSYERPLILGIETSCDDTGAAIGNILNFTVKI